MSLKLHQCVCYYLLTCYSLGGLKVLKIRGNYVFRRKTLNF